MHEIAIWGRAERAKDKELGRKRKNEKLNKIQIRKNIPSKDIDLKTLAEARSTAIVSKLQNARKIGVSNRATAIKFKEYKIFWGQNQAKKLKEKKGKQLKGTFLICKQIQI